VTSEHGGKVAVTIGSQTEYFDLPSRKGIDTQAVVPGPAGAVRVRWRRTHDGLPAVQQRAEPR